MSCRDVSAHRFEIVSGSQKIEEAGRSILDQRHVIVGGQDDHGIAAAGGDELWTFAAGPSDEFR